MRHDGGAQYTLGPANTHAQSSLRGRSPHLADRKTSASIGYTRRYDPAIHPVTR